MTKGTNVTSGVDEASASVTMFLGSVIPWLGDAGREEVVPNVSLVDSKVWIATNTK